MRKMWAWINEKLVALAIFTQIPNGPRERDRQKPTSLNAKLVLTRFKHLLTGRHGWAATDWRSKTVALRYTVVVPQPPQPPYYEDVEYGYFRLERCRCGAQQLIRIRTSWQGKALEIKQEDATQ